MQPIFGVMKSWLSRTRTGVSSHPPVSADSVPAPAEGSVAVAERETVRHGAVSVRDNRVFVTDPDERGSFATLEIPNDHRVRVTLDGRPRIGRVIVREGMEITVELLASRPALEWSTQISPDRMEAAVRLSVHPGERCALADAGPARHLALVVAATPVFPKLPSASRWRARLEAIGLQGEMDDAALIQLALARTSVRATVVRGKPATPGEPPHFVPLALASTAQPSGDWTSVTMGTAVARIEPGLPGVPGVDVLGHPVTPPVPRDTTTIGSGVARVGDRLIALRNGQLVCTPRRVDVVPELVFRHDVTAKQGKVRFDGNVIVYGSVQDGSYIDCTGHVVVHGSVLCATVLAAAGITVSGGVVGSHLVAGQFNLLYKNLYPTLADLVSEFERFREAHTELVQRAERLPDGTQRIPRIADVLLARRFPLLEHYVNWLSNDVHPLLLQDDAYRALRAELRRRWIGIGRTHVDVADVHRMHDLLMGYLERVETVASAARASIRVDSVTSSTLQAFGDIAVTGAGTYASSLESGGSIHVRGMVRGGFLVAHRQISVGELGTPSGTETSAKVVNPDGGIQVATRYPNTLLQVGERRDRNEAVETRVSFREV
ncbi:MAG: FapA family protein [Alicyclobacillus sp.]|nr:FapA family protein [Alicyclobacillus sp.]